jgi:hypothetical protein
MVKMIAAACRRPGMTHDEYIAYIYQVHAALARKNPVTLQRYVQNHVFDSAFGSSAMSTNQMVMCRDSVTELYWSSMEAMQQTFAHPYTQQTIGPDGKNFADVRVSLSLVTTEEPLAVKRPGVGGAKVMHFLRMKEGLTLPEFFTRWSAAHKKVMDESQIAAISLRAYVQSRQLPEANAMLAYFGGEETRPFEGVGSLWYDNEASLAMFRHYEQSFIAVNSDERQAFYEPADSFFLYARAVEVL